MRSLSLYRLVCAWPALHILLLTLLCAFAGWLLLQPASQTWWLREKGPVEGTTAVLFGLLALGGMFWRPKHSSRISWFAVCTLCALAGAREMDWHSRWTGKSIFKISYYLGDAPWAHKLVALFALLLTAWCAIYLLVRYGLQLWRGFLDGNPFARTVVTLVATLVLTKIMDRSVNVLIQDFGLAVAPSVAMLVSLLEETSEMSLPFMVALAIWQNWRQYRPDGNSLLRGR